MSRTANFSVEEDTYIRRNFRDSFDDEIAETLGRPIGSITRRRQRLGCWYVQQEITATIKGESWLQIKDLPEGYMVSNKGRIKTGKKLSKLFINSQSYVQWRVVNPSKGIFKNYKVHRLVAEHFCPTHKDKDDCHVHHKDQNPQNNAWDNLEWLTPQEHLEAHKE